MSNIITLLNHLFTALFSSDRPSIQPDDMNLHDWADLPSHHPSV